MNVTPSGDDGLVSTTASTSRAPSRSATTGIRRDRAAPVAGIVATATALGVSELLAGVLPGATSLVAAVGQVVIDLQPPGAKDVVVGLFGTNDKLALELFIVLVALVVGALLGLVARRRYEIAAGVFVAFGVVGFLAALGDPLVDPGVAAAATAISIGSGLWVLGWLLDRSRPATVAASGADGQVAEMPDWSRRSFICMRGPSGSVPSRSVSSAARCSSDSGPRRSAADRPSHRPR